MDPANYPLSGFLLNERHYDAQPSLVSMLPWQCMNITQRLRHLRLNLYLPNPYNTRLWDDKLLKRLAELLEAIDNGRRLKDMKILIATWYHFHGITPRQAATIAVLRQITIHGHVEVRTRSISAKLRAALQDLDLADKIRFGQRSQPLDRHGGSQEVVSSDMDWDWEGGIII